MLTTKNYIDFKILDSENGSILAEWKGAEKAGRALPEDKVCLRKDGTVEILERASKKPLVGVLQLTSKYMYGMTGHGVPMYCCQPMNKGYPSFRVACKERDRSKNLLVSFQFESWEADCELPRGSLLKVLGVVEDPAAEAEALAILSCPWSAPRPSAIPIVNQTSDRILLSSGTFNIDPVGCLDIDDVLTIESTNDPELFIIWITIADVAESVKKGSKEYEIAEKIGATTYQNGRAVRSMLHRDLSEKALSLLPGELRYGLSLRVSFHLRHAVLNTCFQKVLVQNEKSYTYESAATLEEPFKKVLTAFSCSEDPHMWIQASMLLYNLDAALLLKKMKAGLLRSHEAPYKKNLELLQTLNVNLQFLSYQSAKYVSAGNGHDTYHWGLKAYEYCHATSPLRRFADLVNQQIIKDSLDNMNMKHILEGFTFAPRPTDALAIALNRRQKEIQEAERNFLILTAIQNTDRAQIEGLYLWAEEKKQVFYIPSWKCTIRFATDTDLRPGTSYQIQYFCDRTKASWKERMIYRVAG